MNPLRTLAFLLLLPLAVFAAPYDDTLAEANRLHKADQEPAALATAEKAVRLAPDRFEAHALRALILQSLKRTPEAQQALAAARRLAPPEAVPKLEKIAALLIVPSTAEAGPTQRRRFNVINLILEDADRASDPAQRRPLQDEFLAKSAEYLGAYPDDGRVWTLRARLALELNLVDEGILAARQMQRLGVARQ